MISYWSSFQLVYVGCNVYKAQQEKHKQNRNSDTNRIKPTTHLHEIYMKKFLLDLMKVEMFKKDYLTF